VRITRVKVGNRQAPHAAKPGTPPRKGGVPAFTPRFKTNV
jgi:hypothetical protein